MRSTKEGLDDLKRLISLNYYFFFLRLILVESEGTFVFFGV